MTSHYHLRKWSDHNATLVARGSLDVWVEEAVLSEWKNTEKTRKRGASDPHSDLAIETLLTMKAVYRQKLRQTIGFSRPPPLTPDTIDSAALLNAALSNLKFPRTF